MQSLTVENKQGSNKNKQASKLFEKNQPTQMHDMPFDF